MRVFLIQLIEQQDEDHDCAEDGNAVNVQVGDSCCCLGACLNCRAGVAGSGHDEADQRRANALSELLAGSNGRLNRAGGTQAGVPLAVLDGVSDHGEDQAEDRGHADAAEQAANSNHRNAQRSNLHDQRAGDDKECTDNAPVALGGQVHDLAKQQRCKNRNTVASRVYVADDIGILNDLLAVVRCHRAGEGLVHGKEYEEQEQHDEILVLEQRRNCLFSAGSSPRRTRQAPVRAHGRTRSRTASQPLPEKRKWQSAQSSCAGNPCRPA